MNSSLVAPPEFQAYGRPGATAIKYTLIAALIFLVVTAGAQTAGNQLSAMSSNI